MSNLFNNLNFSKIIPGRNETNKQKTVVRNRLKVNETLNILFTLIKKNYETKCYLMHVMHLQKYLLL